MLKSKKEACLLELEDLYKNSNSIIVTHYHGLKVSDITKLRRSLRDSGATFKVVKNTLANIAASNAGVAHDKEVYAGPTAIAYSDDEVSAAKGVVEFAKTNKNLKIISGLVNNSLVDADTIKQLACLPSLDELRGKIVGLLQAPATNLARVCQAPAGSLARVIKAHADKN